MMEPPVAEFTIICIDNARRPFWRRTLFQAQIEATRLYCETVLKCNPKSIVTILTMSNKMNGLLVPPTSNLQLILNALRGARCQYDGQTQFRGTLYQACLEFPCNPANMKRRLLMFVASIVHLIPSQTRLCGKMLKDSGVALDIFNLFYSKRDPTVKVPPRSQIARMELEILVDIANDNGNCHLIDILGEYETLAVTETKSILKEHLHYLDQKAPADEKNKSAADEKYKIDEAPQFLSDRPLLVWWTHNKKTKKTKDDEFGQTHARFRENQKVGRDQKAAADEKNRSNEAPQIQFVKPGLERFHDEKIKRAADDEYGQTHARFRKKQKVGKDKKAAAGEKNKSATDEKNKSAADEKNKSNEAPPIQFVKPGLERVYVQAAS